MRIRRSQIGALAVAVMVVLSACSGTEARPQVSDDLVSGTVTEGGFAVSLGDLAFSGPAGVAPVGTVVIVKRVDDVRVADTGVVPAARAFDISFSDGSQPEQPMTVTLTLDGKRAATEPVAFATEDSRTGQWTGLPVTRTGDTASVTMTHFSWGFFGWLGDVKASFDDAVNKFLKLRYDPPDCVDTPLGTAAGEMSATASGNGIYVCAEEVAGEPTLTVHSNSPFVWRVAGPDDQVIPVYPSSPIDLTQILTTAVYLQVAQDRAGYETVLVPGGTAGLSVTGTLGPLEASADVDAALGLIAVIVYGIDQAMAMAGVPVSLEDTQKTREIAECIAGIIELGDQPDVGTATRTILGCFGSAVSGVAGVVVGLFTSASSLLVNFVVGAIGQVTQTNHLTIDVTFTGGSADAPADLLEGIPEDHVILLNAENTGDNFGFASPSGMLSCDFGYLSSDKATHVDCHGGSLANAPDSTYCGDPDVIGITGVSIVEKAGWWCAGGINNGGRGDQPWAERRGFPTVIGEIGSPQAVLPYGWALTALPITCVSRTTGVTCENTETNARFTTNQSDTVLSGPTYPNAQELGADLRAPRNDI